MLSVVPRIFCRFLLSPAGCDSGKGDRERARRKTEKRGIWNCACCYLVCIDPPPLPPLLHATCLTCLTCLRLWLSGQEVQQEAPPLPPTPLMSIQRPQCWISVMASIWRLWVWELILDSDGDHFLFSPIFCRTPVRRDIDCYSLAKISEILPGANILSTPTFVTFSAWRASTISWYSAGESPPIRAGRPAATAHLVSARGGINTFWEK